MSFSYLSEHAENTLLALALAEKEVSHLAYTHRTLYAQPINLQWVQELVKREDLAEKIDAFVSRFGRLQDHIGENSFLVSRNSWVNSQNHCWMPWRMLRKLAGLIVPKSLLA